MIGMRFCLGVFTGVLSRKLLGEIGARKLFTRGCILLTIILLGNLRWGEAGVIGFLYSACTLIVESGGVDTGLRGL